MVRPDTDASSSCFLIPSGDTIHGISRGVNDASTVIVTCKKIGVKIVEIFDRQCIKNWTTPPDLRLLASSVQDPKSKVLFALSGPSTMICWPHNTLDIASRIEKEFEENIFQIHTSTVKRKKWSAVAIMKNESICLIDEKLNIVHVGNKKQNPSQRSIIWSSLETIDGDDYVLIIFQSDTVYYFEVFTLYNEPCVRARSLFEIDVDHKESGRILQSASFQAKGSPYLALLWDHEECNVWQFDSVSQLTDSEFIPVRKVHKSFPECKEGSLLSLSPSMVGVVGNDEEGALHLYIYNISWNSIVDRIKLPKCAGKLGKFVYFAAANAVALAFEKEICICKLKETKGTLADALGSIESKREFPGIAPDSKSFARRPIPLCVDASISTGAFLRYFPDQCPSGELMWQYLVKVRQSNEREFLAVEILTNKELTPTLKEFMPFFECYVRSKEVKTNVSTNEFSDLSAPLTQKPSLKLSPYFVSAVSTRCCNDHFWEPLGVLAGSGLLPAASHKDLLPVLMQENQVKLLHVCLTSMKDLDEKSIILLISYFILNKKSSFLLHYLSTTLSLPETSSCDGLDFLGLVVNVPLNEAFTIQNLYSLDIEHVVVLLEYLLKYLRVYSQNSIESLRLRVLCIPLYENVLHWTMMVIDAHATNLLLTSARSVQLMAQIRQELHLQVEICESVENMRGCLTHLLERRSFPKTSLQNYSMEAFYA